MKTVTVTIIVMRNVALASATLAACPPAWSVLMKYGKKIPYVPAARFQKR
jgi:hypothetical protein